MKYLIVGLGNIGPQYELNRHNIGFLILDYLASTNSAIFNSERLGDYALIKFKGKSLHLIKPTNFVNNSGRTVKYWCDRLKIKNENLLIVLDDLSLPYGKLRIKKNGGDGGHNGLKSINELLISNNYPRLRFGIGNEFKKGNQSDYVLENFSKNEMKNLEVNIKNTINIILSYSIEGINRTMNKFN
jgi:PTH1 family peptidyl-tRNA hydrolase|tara:strand:+ start:354 stop:911 length:558 start_codon:yes stop_codon:yes gene_type:complete